MFQQHETIAERKFIGGSFSLCLVDDYQDTNKIQVISSIMLAQTPKREGGGRWDAPVQLTRGVAPIQNILEFSKRYPKRRVFKSEMNYRRCQKFWTCERGIAANVHQFPQALKRHARNRSA